MGLSLFIPTFCVQWWWWEKQAKKKKVENITMEWCLNLEKTHAWKTRGTGGILLWKHS